MKKEYIFNIGIVSTQNEYFFNFVLNTKCYFETTTQNVKSHEENKSDLYELINEVVRRYVVMKNKRKDYTADEKILKQNTSYSILNTAPNYSTQKKITNEKVKESTKYKLGIICNGYYNNRLLEIQKTDTGIINKYATTNILKLFTRISEKLCLLGYNVECVPFNDNDLYIKGAPIINYLELKPIINKNLKFNITNKDNEYKNIANANYYYYKVYIESYVNDVKGNNNDIINVFKKIYSKLNTPVLYFTEDQKNFYILSVHDLLELELIKKEYTDFSQNYENDVNKYIKDVLMSYFEKHN